MPRIMAERADVRRRGYNGTESLVEIWRHRFQILGYLLSLRRINQSQLIEVWTLLPEAQQKQK